MVLRLQNNIVIVSKIIPPFFTIKEVMFESLHLPLAKGSSTSNQAFLLRRKDVTTLSAVFAPPVPPQREGPYPIPKP